MKNMLIYTEEYIMKVNDAETGETITPAHTEKNVRAIVLENVVKVKLGWNSVELMMCDGTLIKIEHAEEIYFR